MSMLQKFVLILIWIFAGTILPFAICHVYLNSFIYYDAFTMLYPIAALLHMDLVGFLLYLLYRKWSEPHK